MAVAEEMAAVIADGEVAEVAGGVAGESGRLECVERRDLLYEDPAAWLRQYAATLVITEPEVDDSETTAAALHQLDPSHTPDGVHHGAMARCPGPCGLTNVEPHPKRVGVMRCANCKEWMPPHRNGTDQTSREEAMTTESETNGDLFSVSRGNAVIQASVGSALVNAAKEAESAIRALDAILTAVLNADDAKPAEESARLKRKADTYRRTLSQVGRVRCDESCHEAGLGTCPKCDTLDPALVCNVCLSYMAQDGPTS